MSRALIISNQYSNIPEAKLNGCFNDSENFISCLNKINPKMEIIVMRDDLPSNSPLFPTRKNIIQQFINFVSSSATKLYFYYSGHGCSITDYNKDERTILFSRNGGNVVNLQSLLQDSCIVTNDITHLNILVDDEISEILKLLKESQTLYGFLDSCNSGTGFDLCYINAGRFIRRFNSNNNLTNLQKEIKNNCSLVSSFYPDKLNSIKGNVILISGTRDKNYSFESYINGKVQGHFTTKLCWLLEQNINTNLLNFYYMIIGLINNNQQIPVLTLSKNININNYLMNDFNINKSITGNKARTLLIVHLMNK